MQAVGACMQVNIMGNITEPFLSEDRFEVALAVHSVTTELHCTAFISSSPVQTHGCNINVRAVAVF